jgi:predicted anti-sigma-YlaC factor YlaD
MHDSVKLRLEEYLESGVPLPEIEDHLRNCDGCREEAEAMRQQARLFQALRAPANLEPGPGF